MGITSGFNFLWRLGEYNAIFCVYDISAIQYVEK